MEKKVVKMIIYYVLSVYGDEENNMEGCIKITETFLEMLKNEETKLDGLLNLFPIAHPVSVLYSGIRETSTEELIAVLERCREKFINYKEKNVNLKEIKDAKELEELCEDIVN